MNQESKTNRSVVIGVIVVAAIIGVLLLISSNQTQDPSSSRNQSDMASNSPDEVKAPAAPPPAKPPGFDEVETRVAEVLAEGCKHVLQKPGGVKGTTAWTPQFMEGDDAPCLNVIAASGDPQKPLHISIRKPTGEKVEDKTLVEMVDFVYCADMGGPHSVNVFSPSNDRYTFAAVDCPRDLALKRLAEKADKQPVPNSTTSEQ